MEQPVKFEKWLYQNHRLTSLSQVRNKQKYIDGYERYCKNLYEACMSEDERKIEEWQTKIAPITVAGLAATMILAMLFVQ